MTMPPFNKDPNEFIYRQGPVWCERNLMLHPLVILSCLDFQKLLKNNLKTGVSLTCEYTDGDIKRIWKLTPHIELGYPGTQDKDVLITIQKLITDTGLPPPNPFALPSLRQICELMGIRTHGPKYGSHQNFSQTLGPDWHRNQQFLSERSRPVLGRQR